MRLRQEKGAGNGEGMGDTEFKRQYIFWNEVDYKYVCMDIYMNWPWKHRDVWIGNQQFGGSGGGGDLCSLFTAKQTTKYLPISYLHT